jgi:hypothetical protein
MEGKRFSADVKYEDPVKVQIDDPIIFISNEHPFGNETFSRKFHVVRSDRA